MFPICLPLNSLWRRDPHLQLSRGGSSACLFSSFTVTDEGDAVSLWSCSHWPLVLPRDLTFADKSQDFPAGIFLHSGDGTIKLFLLLLFIIILTFLSQWERKSRFSMQLSVTSPYENLGAQVSVCILHIQRLMIVIGLGDDFFLQNVPLKY